MQRVSGIAAKHSALWALDEWYRIWWSIFPALLALLICGWIIAAGGRNSTTAPAQWGKPVPDAPPQPIRRSPVLANWPETLHRDVISCFSNTVDQSLIEACTRLIDSGIAPVPQLVAAYSQRGMLRRLKDPDLALGDFNSALNLQADSPIVLTNRALIYISNSQFAAALQDLNRAIELLPPAVAGRPRLYRGYTYFKLKNFASSAIDLNEAIKVDAWNPEPYFARGELERVQEQYDTALKDYDEFSKRVPQSARGLIGRGSVLQATGHADEALQAYEKALALEPMNAQAIAARDQLRALQRNANQTK